MAQTTRATVAQVLHNIGHRGLPEGHFGNNNLAKCICCGHVTRRLMRRATCAYGERKENYNDSLHSNGRTAHLTFGAERRKVQVLVRHSCSLLSLWLLPLPKLDDEPVWVLYLSPQ